MRRARGRAWCWATSWSPRTTSGSGGWSSPFGPELPLPGRSYHFVCAKGQERRPAIKAFRDWLFAEIAETFAKLPPGPASRGHSAEKHVGEPRAAATGKARIC